ncbi:MAG: hypothetical protein AB7N76_04870 [Planctomycetota bacterium]
MRRTLCALTLLLTLGAPSFAQDEDDPPPPPPAEAKPAPEAVMDEVAKAAFKKWRELEYHLGDAGVKTAKLSIAAKLESGEEGAEARQTTGSYEWDGKAGKLTWADEEIGLQLGEQGWSNDRFTEHYSRKDELKELRGCELKGEKKEDGAVVVTIAKGTPTAPFKAFHFDKAGVMSAIVLDGPEGSDVKFTLSYKKVGEKHLATGWTYSVKTEEGTIESTMVLESAEVGGFHVVKKSVETIKQGEKLVARITLEFKDHKLNEVTK